MKGLRDFLAADRVRVVTLSDETTTVYPTLFRYLRQQGRPIPTNHIWIAALCFEHEATLCTRDRHFEALPQIDVRYPE